MVLVRSRHSPRKKEWVAARKRIAHGNYFPRWHDQRPILVGRDLFSSPIIRKKSVGSAYSRLRMMHASRDYCRLPPLTAAPDAAQQSHLDVCPQLNNPQVLECFR